MDSATGVAVLSGQVTSAAIIVWIIQLLKGWAKLPAISEASDKICRSLGVLGALLSASGILIVSNWDGAEHTFTLIVSGVTVANVAGFIWTAIGSFVNQEIILRILKASKASKF